MMKLTKEKRNYCTFYHVSDNIGIVVRIIHYHPDSRHSKSLVIDFVKWNAEVDKLQEAINMVKEDIATCKS
jgi:hypothetical protein